MRWLGDHKDAVEETRLRRRRDLFTDLSLAFFDTTSLYFEGQGGESLGRCGCSKDHRPDHRQMMVGAVLTGAGQTVCCELWPGNQADSRALLPVVDRLRRRFAIRKVCWVEDRRYIVCYNPQEAAKDAVGRQAILEDLEDKLKQGAKSMVGNRGYRRFLKVERGAVSLDAALVAAEARFDGKYVPCTDTTLIPSGTFQGSGTKTMVRSAHPTRTTSRSWLKADC